MEKTVTINTDGGSRGNPGPGACAFVASSPLEQFKQGKYLGVTTNNQAEYNAVILALNWLSSQSDKYHHYTVNFKLDSLLVVKQLNGEYKIKDPNLYHLNTQIHQLIHQLHESQQINFNFTHVPREQNSSPDGLLNRILDGETA